MHRLMQPDGQLAAGVVARAQGACVVLPDALLPTGCIPSRARVGIEIDPGTGRAALLVDRRVVAPGGPAAVRDWLLAGRVELADAPALAAWVRTALGAPLDAPMPSRSGARLPGAVPEASDLREALEKRVVGQRDALDRMAGRVARHLARVEPRRPATLSAVGPTGVGKTESALALADVLARPRPGGRRVGFLRLDMSEYQEAHQISRLLGAPPGYVGHDHGALLSDRLRAQPHTLVLFDEIEKAHPAVLAALMNAMDAGRLSIAGQERGTHEVDCRHAIFLMTSNLAADAIVGALAGPDAGTDRWDDVCRTHLGAAGVAPWILGRISTFLVYRPLDGASRRLVARLAVERVGTEYGIPLVGIAEEAIDALLDSETVEALGSRPLEHRADELFGSCFAQGARHGRGIPARLLGPPWRLSVAADPAASPPEAGRPSASRRGGRGS